MGLRRGALFCRQSAQIPCVVQFFRRRASGLERAVCRPRVLPQPSRGQILVRRASLFAFFFVRVKRLRVRTHAHLLRGVQVFACALCVSCVPPCARACGNSLRCASFCMCTVCLDVCGVCLGARAHAQTPCGVQVFVCALCVVLCVVNVGASACMRKCCAVYVFCYYWAY